MKTLNKITIILAILFLPLSWLSSQVNLAEFSPKEGVIYLVQLTDGTTFTGQILSYDAREVRMKTFDKGEIIFPKLQLESISEPDDIKLDEKGKFLEEDRFATRYFLTTNGLPIKKGEHYSQFNIYGPEVHFALADNVGVGIMTSWFFSPILGTVKYSFQLGDKVSMALGGIGGFFGWLRFNQGIALPYATLTLGDRRSNLSFTGGYGAYFNDGVSVGRPLFSVAGLHKFSNKYSLVLDSFLAPKDINGFGIVTLGVRYQSKQKTALQFGLSTIWFEDYIVPVPIPTGSLFLRL